MVTFRVTFVYTVGGNTTERTACKVCTAESNIPTQDEIDNWEDEMAQEIGNDYLFDSVSTLATGWQEIRGN